MSANYRVWFLTLPARTRLTRLLRDYARLVLEFLGEPSFFTMMNTYGIELAWLINDTGEVVDWAWDTAKQPDNAYRPLAVAYEGETITLANLGLREKDAPPSNMHCCERGTWNERFTIETNLSWVTELFAQKLYHRVKSHLEAHVIADSAD